MALAASTSRESKVRNLVLRSLRPEAQDYIAARAMTRRTYAGEIVYEAGAPFTHVVFPQEGMISIMAEEELGRTVEKASIGQEGFLGFNLLLGGDGTVSKTIVTVPGYASWLSKRDLDDALEKFECVRKTMLLYAQCLIVQLMESLVCSSLHSAEQRVARRLLHAHDSVQGDVIALTQQALAHTLGIRRATVSDACSNFQNAAVIDYTRGVLTITDRLALEQRVCRCYRRIRRQSLLQAFDPVYSPVGNIGDIW